MWGRRGAVLGCALSLAGCTAPRPGTDAVVARDCVRAAESNREGLGHVAAGRLAQAEQAFRAAIAADLYCGPAHANLGAVLLQRAADAPERDEGTIPEQGSPLYEAATECTLAAKLMPQASQPRANLALLLESVGRRGEAEEELRAALRLNPGDVQIMGHLARLHLRQSQRSPETRRWLESVALRDPSPDWRAWAMGQLSKYAIPESE